MKVKNTVFFGAMAAILMSTGANAAITQIASTDYVNSVVSTKADATTVESLSDTVTTMGNKIGTGEMTVGGTAVETIVGAINALDAKAVDAYTKAEADETFATKEGLGKLATMDTVGTDQIDDKSVTEAKLDADVQKKLNDALTDANLENVLTKDSLAGYTGKADMAIPQPSSACTAASGTCVLTVSTGGTLEWMQVTPSTTTSENE